MTQARLRSQARACSRLLEETLKAAFSDGTPADKFLNSVFRRERAIGSRDRNLFSQAVFAAFRWRGWLMRIPPCDQSAAMTLLGALAAEGSAVPAAAAWAEEADVSLPAYEDACSRKSSQDRMAAFASLCGCPGVNFDKWDLIPGWARDGLCQSANQEGLVESLQKRPPVWLRAQTSDIKRLASAFEREGAQISAHPFMKDAMMLSGKRLNLPAMPEFRDGLFEVQDVSSQCIGRSCLPKPGESWWDACAGSGGKSLQLACLMRGEGAILSTDIDPRKIEELERRAARASLRNIGMGLWNGEWAPDGRAPFDGVLVDAPCSSSGRWRRNPDARWIANEAWAKGFPEIQSRILAAAADAVRPGGTLVYATCSLFERENSGVVAKFLESRPDFRLEPFPNPLDGSMAGGTLSVTPLDADGDASFMARFRRA